MKSLPLSEDKAKLGALVNAVEATGKAIAITRSGKPAAVLISVGEYESWKETMAVRGDPRLMREIKAGLRSLNAGRSKVYTLDELFAEPAPRKRRA
jgi:prevent-host-death family protein